MEANNVEAINGRRTVSESEFQRECERFVRNEVYACVSTLMDHLHKTAGESDYEDEIYSICGSWTRREVPQNCYRLKVNDAGPEWFDLEVFELEYDQDWYDLCGYDSWDEGEPAFETKILDLEAGERHPVMDVIEDLSDPNESAASILAFLIREGFVPKGSSIYLDGDDPEINEYEDEIFEHWIVSGWLANKLKAKGEAVADDILGMTIWGRGTSGQSISIDGVIQEIVGEALNITSSGRY